MSIFKIKQLGKRKEKWLLDNIVLQKTFVYSDFLKVYTEEIVAVFAVVVLPEVPLNWNSKVSPHIHIAPEGLLRLSVKYN